MKAFFTLLILINVSWMNAKLFAQNTVSTNTSFSNTIDPVDIANNYIKAHLKDWGLTPADIDGMTISDHYTDKSSGITRIYFEQRYKGIPVNYAILNVCLTKDDKVYYSTSRFIPNLEAKINTALPSLSATDAIYQTAMHFGFPQMALSKKSSIGPSQNVFTDPAIAREDITAELCYQSFEGKLYLSWDVFFAPNGTHDGWNTRVDANSGQVLNQVNRTLYCHVDGNSFDRPQEVCYDEPAELPYKIIPSITSTLIEDDPLTGPQYNVWPYPIESPKKGPRTMVINPADPTASPFGWHDTDGQPGNEYTVTGGNNAYVYQDTTNSGFSSHDEPDGGPGLVFDFPFDTSWEPRQYIDAAQVNLFYWLNHLHDFTYHFGFDEAAGNFQKNNYGHGGLGNDFVFGVTQDGSTGDSLFNNAEYLNKPEGTSPSIFMFDFIAQDKYLVINEPAAIAGHYLINVPSAGWGAGAYVSDIPVTGEVVLVNDGVESPSTADACQDILNASEINGKIALIDRGACQFGFKALQAQNAGAIAVIICSADNKLYTMAAGPDAPNVNIPVVSIPLNYSKTIRQYAGHGLKVTIVNPSNNHPARFDSDLDNALIGHEYGHGLSIRLAGGPDKMCLDNAEQMGEGWCDYLGLVNTVKPGDVGTMPRGLGTYLFIESTLANGIRRYPYSTDMKISPLTYGDVAINQERHEIGEVWANMLWDMYWAMVEKYGWSEDPYHEQSGNYKATRLVVDGLKNMACDPGFVDARNAILAADVALYNGENSCLLWEVFARRGLGYSADQGSSDNAGDQIEAFDVPPSCSGSIHIEKSMTDFIQPGDDIQVTLHIGNYKNDTATNVVVTDQVPDGATYKFNSSNYTAIQQGHDLLFDLRNMIANEVDTITYTLHTPGDVWSQRLFLDEVADTNNLNWTPLTIGVAAFNNWSITDTLSAHTGSYSWTSKEIADKSQQTLVLNPDVISFHVSGQHPALRFYHRYDTQSGLNGGLVEIRVLGETNWEQAGDEMVRNGYKRKVDYRTFISTGLSAFSGYSGDEFQATYVDLSKWAGQDIQVRFRFGTYTNTHAGMGWCIDDIEFMDLQYYNEEACVATDQGDFACAIAPEEGTIVDSREDPVSGTETLRTLDANIFPNPASDVFTISLALDEQQEVHVDLFTMDGQLVSTKTIDGAGHNQLNVHTANLPSGFYLVKVWSAEGQYVSKLIIQR